MIQLKRNILRYSEVKIQLLLISLNKKLLVFKLKAIDMQIFYVACQSRDGDLDNFLVHEKHLYPLSISEYGKLGKCLTKHEMKIIDGATFVNMNKGLKARD